MEKKSFSKPLISIIVPVYKVEQYIRKCVDSIRNQTYTNLEIILVDDGSPDGSGKICDEYAEKDARVKVVHKKNGGLSSARNAGLEISKGEYIGFVDSDDYIKSTMYEQLFHLLKSEKTKLAVCAMIYVFENGKQYCKPRLGKNCTYDFQHAIIEMNMHRYFDMGACSKLYHRSLFENLRFPVGKQSEDFYIMYILFDRAKRISYLDIPCYYYFQRENSITRNSAINHDHEYAAREQMRYLDEKYPELKVVGHISYASAALTVYDLYLKNQVPCPKEQLKHFGDIVENNKVYLKRADYLSNSKKFQFLLFNKSPALYRIIFKIYRKLKRV